MRPPIGVTAREMLEMREAGNSNRDIANLLEISLGTVYAYIGAHGCRMDSLKAFDKRPRPEIHQLPVAASGKVVYIAGPITGVADYKSKFDKASGELRAAGFIPLSPAWQPSGMRNEQYMRICFSMIDAADAVLFLPGYLDSDGARLEFDYCRYIKKPIELSVGCIERRFMHG